MTTRHELIKAALLTQLEAKCPGFVAYLPYEPLAVTDFPLLYVLFDRADDVPHNQQADRTYSYLVRAVFMWSDVEGAELEIDPWVDALRSAIYADIQLGGVVSRGRAFAPSVVGKFLGWQGPAGPTYRVLDMTVQVVDKTPWDFVRGQAL